MEIFTSSETIVGFKLHLISQCIEFLKLLNKADFNGWSRRILAFIRTRLTITPYSPLKPTKVGFVLLGLSM